MAIVSALSPISLAQFFYASGKLVRPARLFFYKPNTEDAVIVYTDPTLGVPYDQPVLTGGSGRVPPIYISTEPYRIRIFDSFGAMVEDIEYLPGASSLTGEEPGAGPPAGNALQTGDMFFSFATSTTQRAGCVRANGGLIGPIGFDATGYVGQIERINDDTEALFTWLWGQDGANTLAVIPSKGSTAANDWAQKKAIYLPDLRGRALVGLDGMGLAEAGRLAGVVTYGHKNYSGSTGGTATATLAVANMPLHTHTVTANATGVGVSVNLTGITLAGAVASLNPTTTGITSTQVGPTGIGIYGNSTGIYLTDVGHSHTTMGFYSDPAHPYGVTNTGGLGYNFVTSNSSLSGVTLVDPWHIHAVYDPTHSHGISDPAHNHPQTLHFHTLTDPQHTHAVTDPTHTHGLSAEGGNVAFPTISPFCLAVVYIKL